MDKVKEIKSKLDKISVKLYLTVIESSARNILSICKSSKDSKNWSYQGRQTLELISKNINSMREEVDNQLRKIYNG